eukprot:10175733-Alexandrium_andersonii.AAC.1
MSCVTNATEWRMSQAVSANTRALPTALSIRAIAIAIACPSKYLSQVRTRHRRRHRRHHVMGH